MSGDTLTSVNRLVGYVSAAIILILLVVSVFLISNTLPWVLPCVEKRSQS